MSNPVPGQLPLFDLAPYDKSQPPPGRGTGVFFADEVTFAWSRTHGAVAVHAGYVKGKQLWSRPVDPAREHFDALPLRDQELDASIALALANALTERGKNDDMMLARLFAPADDLSGQRAPRQAFTDALAGMVAWARHEAAKTAHGAWHDGMVKQGRHIDARFKHWEELDVQDRDLFAEVAASAITSFHAWRLERIP